MVGRSFLAHRGRNCHDVIAPTRQQLNLFDRVATEQFLARCRPDVILHAAGRVGGIESNIRKPVQFLVENADIGCNVVMAALAAGVRRLINLGSSCMYPRNVEDLLREDMILSGELEPTNEGYALAKIMVARLCEYVSRQYPSFHYKTLIPCNLYGPFDNFDPGSSHLLAALIRKLHEAKTNGAAEVVVWGTGRARREFMYAGDLADCLYKAIDSFDPLPPAMNVGVGKDCTVLEYYQAVASVVGYSGTFTFDPSKPEGMKRKLLDVSRSHQWGWHATTSLLEGLRRTYEYFLQQEPALINEASAR